MSHLIHVFLSQVMFVTLIIRVTLISRFFLYRKIRCVAKISCNKVTRYVNSKLLYHGQFNNSISADWWPRQNLDKSNSLYDLDIFSLNCNLDA